MTITYQQNDLFVRGLGSLWEGTNVLLDVRRASPGAGWPRAVRDLTGAANSQVEGGWGDNPHSREN
jgi:hypothetical protein